MDLSRTIISMGAYAQFLTEIKEKFDDAIKLFEEVT